MGTSRQPRQSQDHQPGVQIVGVACRRQDRAPLWLVTSQHHHEQPYTVVQVGTVLHCTCLAGHHRRARCKHRDAVRQWLIAQEDHRRAQERQQREQAERRERALLWTDDRPFSIWRA